MQTRVLLLTVASLAVVLGAQSDVKDAPAGAHYGGGSYGAAASPPQYPVFQFPNYDVNYCSVHASFPLVGLDKKHHHSHRPKRQTYGVPAQDSPSFDSSSPIYSTGPVFGPRPRPFDRQGCRNTAVYSRTACQKCCQISSRASGSTNPVVGLLLIFDPKLSAERKHHKKDDESSNNRAIQCVCCTSRKV